LNSRRKGTDTNELFKRKIALFTDDSYWYSFVLADNFCKAVEIQNFNEFLK